MSRKQQVWLGLLALAVLSIVSVTLFDGVTSLLFFKASYILARFALGFFRGLEYPYKWTCSDCADAGTSTTFRTNVREVLDSMVEDHILTFHSE